MCLRLLFRLLSPLNGHGAQVVESIYSQHNGIALAYTTGVHNMVTAILHGPDYVGSFRPSEVTMLQVPIGTDLLSVTLSIDDLSE
jgi:hypothetical protein